MKNRFPSLFISHGAPTYALEPGLAGKQLSQLGRQLAENGDLPSAILVMSPHWMTQGYVISDNPQPHTMYDFSGFPKALESIKYPAKGAPQVAIQAFDILKKAGLNPRLDSVRGLDHGAWVPLLHLFPNATIPVFQVSMPADLTALTAYQFGELFSPLRNEGVLIIGSGSLTHNLYEVEWQRQDVAAYATDFVAYMHDAVSSGDVAKLISAIQLAPNASRAHPTQEHFLPLLMAAGAGGLSGGVGCLPGGMLHHVLSMESYLFDINSYPELAVWKI
jgi:4,5-DOPA dioxygenase extradiol